VIGDMLYSSLKECEELFLRLKQGFCSASSKVCPTLQPVKLRKVSKNDDNDLKMFVCYTLA
jgi:hypothetical protein